MTACNRPGCGGTIDETGFCDRCARRPQIPGGQDDPRAAWHATGAIRLIDGIVPLPVLEFPDPDRQVIDAPEVPEEARFCPECGLPVGRGYAGQKPLIEGFCPYEEGVRFSFRSPELRRGDRIDDRYQIVGYLARGGMGWVFLARDLRLDLAYMALKRPITTSAASLAVQAIEEEALIALDHPNLVRIFNVVTARDRETRKKSIYLVMEFLNGVSLASIQQRADRHGVSLPLEHLVAHGLEILAALEYLHGRGRLYTDLKPDNVIRCADRVKLIDMGGVWRAGDRGRPLLVTKDYCAPELAATGPTVRSDVYSAGRTLEVLYAATDEARAGTDEALEVAIESFLGVTRRAAEKDPNRRFASAAAMAEQLRGVAREVLALRSGEEHPHWSTVFDPTPELLDAGLGTVPPLARWTGRDGGAVPDAGRPAPHLAATRLPTPRVLPDDSAARFLDGAPEAVDVIERLLPELGARSVGIQFAGCRSYVELGDIGRAAECLAAATRLASESEGETGWEWRAVWHEGLLALAEGDLERASARFDAVYLAVPGELAPKLALGYCAEARSESILAKRYYHAVWVRDRSQASAAFGLARIRLAQGDRSGAVTILEQVPPISRHHDAARIAAFQIRCGIPGIGGVGVSEPELPEAASLRQAAARLSRLRLAGGALQGETRERLVTLLREAALTRAVATGVPATSGAAEILGEPSDEPRLRMLLERSYRALARQADRPETHAALIDLANQVRPRTLR